MICLSLFKAIVFLGVFACTLNALAIVPPRCEYSYCSYTGDPHLIPFSQPNTQYWCKKTGWELLLSNDYVSLYVLVDGAASYYSIIDYVLVFPGPPSCNTFGSSSNAYPCIGASSPVTTSVSGNTRIYRHKTQCLIIKIVQWGRYFNFYIWQGPTLVKQSCGVCVRWDCQVENRYVNPDTTIPQICDGFVKAAQTRTIGVVDEATVELARTSCVNDIQTSLDVDNGRVAATTVLQGGLEDLLAGDDADAVFVKLEQSVQEAVREATLQANVLLANAGKICNENRCVGLGSTPVASTTRAPVTKVPITAVPILQRQQA